jgi:hypothetical protein
MRFPAVGMVAVAALLLSACGPVHPVDPEDAAERALAGATLGGALGTGLGATFAINPSIGAIIGVETGATLGAAAGVITAAPVPTYHPMVIPAEAVIPGFYDGWPPGWHSAPGDPETKPPPAG